MSDEKIKLQFAPLDPLTDERGKARTQSPVVEINNGHYDRKFEAKDQPFECDEEEAALLLRTGHFVVVSEPGAVATESTPDSSAPARQARGKVGGVRASAE